jgi:hypothetical protein
MRTVVDRDAPNEVPALWCQKSRTTISWENRNAENLDAWGA